MKMDLNVNLLIVIIISSVSSIFVEKRNILFKPHVMMLTKKNMSDIINYIFPESRCCNVYINSSLSEEESEIFRWFIYVYQEEYFLNITGYECSDYLFIAVQDKYIINLLRRFPVEETTTRIFVIVDSFLNNNSGLYNVTLYQNSNVVLVDHNGTFILSETYLKPRIFKHVNSLSHTVQKKGIVDMMGRNVDASTFFNPPLCYLKTTVNKTVRGIPAEVFLMNNKRELDGVEFRLFTIIAESLNISYTLRKPIGRYNHGRKYNSTAWDGGMLGQIIRKEVDIAFGGIWVNLENLQFVSVSESWSQIFVRLLVPRPQARSSFWALTRPLSPGVWLVVLGLVVLESAYIWGKAHLDPLVPRRFRHAIVTSTEVMGRMLGTWLPRTSPSLRLHFLLWEITGFLIVTCYCSSLAAWLTNPEFEERIDTVRQFIQNNLTWGREKTAPQFTEFFNLEDKYGKQMPSRFVLENSTLDRIQRILKGNHAVLGKIVGNVYYPEGYINNEALKMLRVMSESTAQFYTGFAVQPWLLHPINTIMLRLKESGLVLYHLRDVTDRRTGPNLREVFVEYDRLNFDQAVVLTLNPLGVGFASLLFGLIAATIVFYMEIRTSQNLRDQLNFKKSWKLQLILWK